MKKDIDLSSNAEQMSSPKHDERALLSESLSSLFFKNLKLSNENSDVKKEIKSKKNKSIEKFDMATDHLPVPPPRGLLKDSNTPVKITDSASPSLSIQQVNQRTLNPTDSEIREVKRKETAAAVASMKVKLRNMGMLGRTGETNRKVDLSGRRKSGASRSEHPVSDEIAERGSEKEDKEEEEDHGDSNEMDSDHSDNNNNDDDDDDDDNDNDNDSDNIRVEGSHSALNDHHTTPLLVKKIKEKKPSEDMGDDKNIYLMPSSPHSIHEKKREEKIDIEELSFDNNEDSLEIGKDYYEEECSEDYGSIEATIQFGINPVISQLIDDDSHQVVMKAEEEEEEEVHTENVFFESESESEFELEVGLIRENSQEKGEITIASASPHYTGKEDDRSEDKRNKVDENVKKTDEKVKEEEDSNEEDEKEKYLYDLFVDQEARLRSKAAHCKQIIRYY